MKIRTKILCTLVGMSTLVAAVGGLAVNRQRAAGVLAATKEAENTARVISVMFDADESMYHTLSQNVIGSLYRMLGRDVEVLGPDKRILADAISEHVGSIEHDDEGGLDLTFRDGMVRTYIETSKDYPHGIRQIAVPSKTETGKVEGAVVLEYTAHYNEMLALTRRTSEQVVAAALASIVIALLLALYIGRSIAMPLRQLTRAAAGFAAGETGLAMPAPRKDEIGELTSAFSIMVRKRRQAEEALRQARDELEVRVKERTAELVTTNAQLQKEVAERSQAEEAARLGAESVQKLAEDLARERARMSEIVNSVPAMVFEHWTREGAGVNFISNYLETMLGFTAEEWFSTPDFWASRIHPDDKERVMADTAQQFAGECSGDPIQFRWITKGERVVWGETYLNVIRNAEGAPGLRGFVVDITRQKQASIDLEGANQQLIETSRHAGMAEVATNVLHNVGNVLNSVNVSTAVASELVRQSSAPHLGRAAGLLEQNAGNLGEYLSSDPVGRKLPGFLGQLAGQLKTERTSLLKELEHLGKNVEHIKDIVAVQQSYASTAGMSQTVAVVDLVEDSLRMNAGALMRHDVRLIREFEAQPVIRVDKHKVMQILVNLIRNAKYACDESGLAEKKLTVRVSGDERTVRISVIDNGVGIPPENMTLIFSHGFTTRKSGHGFGLHSGALAARELGGALLVHSDGPASGATFTLELPMESTQSQS